MRRILLPTMALALLLPMAVGGTTPASGRAGGSKIILKPSGTVSIDPAKYLGEAPLPNDVIPPTVQTFGCSDRDHPPLNARANQECTNQTAPGFQGRSQSQNETSVAVNPLDPNNILISQNDYRRGDATCGVNYSLDGGQHWGSEVAPVGFTRGFQGGARHYFTSAGDTSVAFDSRGEAYLMCQVFDRGFPTNETGLNQPFGPSGFVILRSADGGASWSFPADYVVVTPGTGEDGVGLHDKELMTIDNNPVSPFRNRIYVAWTRYNFEFTRAPIYFAYSEDHGVTWHQTGAISGVSSSLCPVPTSGIDEDGAAPDAPTCDNSQFPQPFVSPNGDVYVTFINANNCRGFFHRFGCDGPRGDNHQQILIVKSTDGGNTFGDPVKVGDYFDLPDCATYTREPAAFGRSCVPTAPLSRRSVFRAANYPSGVAVDANTIVVDYGSYINSHSNQSRPEGEGRCVPAGYSAATFLPLYDGVGEVNGCNNDIVVSMSTNGGASFTGDTTDVRQLPTRNDEGPQLADQWFQWSALAPSGQVIGSYEDRKYDADMASGRIDVTLAIGLNGGHVRVTSRSMPPSNEFPGVHGYSLFRGDYDGLAVGSDGVAHPAWPDSRNPIYIFDPAGDARELVFAGYGSDIYTASIPT